MMMPPTGTGSSLDSLLPAAGAVAPRPPENDIKAARELAGRITPATMEEFFGAVRTQTHTQLEALAFVLHEEYPNRISDQIKKEVAERLVSLRTEVLGDTTTDEALRKIENRLEWVRRLLTRPSVAAAPAPAATTAPAAAPGFLTSFFSGITTQVMSMVRGRPATVEQQAKAEAQSKALAGSLAEGGERLLDSIIAAPELLNRIPGAGILTAPITFVAGLMGSNPETRRDRAARRQAERMFRAALPAAGVTCAVQILDDTTWASLKAAANPPNTAPNIVAMLQAWVKIYRDSGVTGPLTLGSPADLVNLDGLRKQLTDKRTVEQRTLLTTNIGARLGRQVATLTPGTEVQMQSNGSAVSLTARLGDPTAPAAPLGTTPSPVAPVAPTGSPRDFDDAGNPVTNEAKTLVGAMRKFPRATRIRIVATGTPEMANPNELTIPTGSFDETGTPQTNEARTIVGMSVKFPNATKLRLAGNYEMANSTEFSATAGGFADNGNPATADARAFEAAVRTLTGATKITLSQRDNARIDNQTEFTLRASTRVADLQRLAGLAPDDAVQTITINSGMLPRDIPILERRDNGVELNSHPDAVAKIVEAGGWGGVMNRFGSSTRLNLLTMRPITSATT